MPEKDWGSETYWDPAMRKYKKRKTYKGSGESKIGERFSLGKVQERSKAYGAKQQAEALMRPKQGKFEPDEAYAKRVRAYEEKQKKQ